MRPVLRVTIPTNRTYTSKRNHGKPRGMDGQNEIIGQNRANRHYAAKMERQNVDHCAEFIREAMAAQGYEPMTEEDRQRCSVLITIHEPNDRRDVPNVLGGVLKYACDALTARHARGAGAIWDDSVRWMPALRPTVRVDPEHVGLTITVIPLEDK